nr:helix-turn-helix transcriptional regulator [Sphingobacterium sp. UT-1RO-CII-1]
MPIKIHLDDMMSKRKMSLNELSQKVGITLSNLSIIKNQKSKAIRLSTLDALCRVLDCQPGDLIKYVEDDEEH